MSQGLMGTLARAAEYAQAQQHGEVSLEHLLLALTEDGDATPVLAASHVDLALLTADVSQYLGGMEPHAASAGAGQLGISVELKRILEAAAAAASQGRRREINGAIVLAAIVGDGRSSAAHMLRGQGLTFEEAIKALQRAMAAPVAPVPLARPAALASTAPVDSEDILATARQRVQSRAAPGLPPAPARVEPTQVMTPAPAPVSELESIKAAKPAVPARPSAAVAADFRDAMTAEIDAYRDDRALDAVDDRHGGADALAGNDHQHDYAQERSADLQLLDSQPEAHHWSAQAQADVASAAEPPPVLTVGVPGPPPVPQKQPVQKLAPQRPSQFPPPLPSQLPPQLPHLLPDHPVWPDAIPGGSSRNEIPPPVSGQRWPAPVEPAWREQQAVEPHPYQPPYDVSKAGGPPPLPAPFSPSAPYAGERPNWSGDDAPPRAMPQLADRGSGSALQTPPRLPASPAPEAGFWPVSPEYSPPAQPSAAPTGVALPASAKARGKPKTAAVVSGHLVENVPRRMQSHRPVVVEVRLAKADLRGLVDGLHGGGQAYSHAMLVAPAMSVRLRAPQGGFTIEPGSPETQWVETRLGLIEADFATWRWTVTPKKAGKTRLQLVVSARTFGADGMAADTALPDQIVDVRVVTNYGRVATKAASWVAIAVAGGALATFGKVFADPVIAAVMAALK
jgi:neural Wiskott-Aldrich syndrome protein